MDRLLRSLAAQRGFSLIEMLVVMLIAGVLAAIAVPVYMDQRAKGADSEVKLTVRAAATALATHFTDHETFDVTLAELVEIEPTLGEASPDLAVSGDEGGFRITERSHSGTTFTFVRERSGEIRRTCSDPGRGLCRGEADPSGNRW